VRFSSLATDRGLRGPVRFTGPSPMRPRQPSGHWQTRPRTGSSESFVPAIIFLREGRENAMMKPFSHGRTPGPESAALLPFQVRSGMDELHHECGIAAIYHLHHATPSRLAPV